MIKEVEISVHPDFISDHEAIKIQAAKKLKLNRERIKGIKYVKKSIDSRGHIPVFKLRMNVLVDKSEHISSKKIEFLPVNSNKRVIIIGAGPGGLFAALKLIQMGIKPVILERGKDVQSRRKDLRKIHLESIVNGESNYCFGEGGAGTYSDGKLYTRSTKRGNISEVLELLTYHGAVEDILVDSHPHIGSNKLPGIIKNIRNTIIASGGEVYFNSKVTDLIITKEKVIGVIVNDSTEIIGDAVILATGHSARDIFYLLQKRGVALEAKSFAMGVRIEHPQNSIDRIQYHMNKRHHNLPAASYNLVTQVEGRGVFSFCMCPGGILVPASTAQEELVLNGMSVSRRDSPFANSGLVVSVEPQDYVLFEKYGMMAGLELQKAFESNCYNAAKSQLAPAQRVTDFVAGKISNDFPKTSYKPGFIVADLSEIIPDFIYKRLRSGLLDFDRKMKGYISEEAVIAAPESRTSSPVRILRNPETLMSINLKGLFPVGEGAGYAGGIVSAAVDGINSAIKAGEFVIN